MFEKVILLSAQVGYFLSRALTIVFIITFCYCVYLSVQCFRNIAKRNKHFAVIPGPPRFNFLLGNVPLFTLKNLFSNSINAQMMYISES